MVRTLGRARTVHDAAIASLPGRRYRLLVTQLAGTQAERGRILGIHQTHVGRIERGERGASVEALEHAIVELGIEPAFFFDRSLGETPNHRAHVRNVVPARPGPVETYITERERSGRPVSPAVARRAVDIARAAHAVTRMEAVAIVDLAEDIAKREASGVHLLAR